MNFSSVRKEMRLTRNVIRLSGGKFTHYNKWSEPRNTLDKIVLKF